MIFGTVNAYTVASYTFSPNSGTLKIGDSTTLDIHVTSGTIYANCTINGTSPSSSSASEHIYFTYTVSQGDTTRSANNLPISLNICSDSGMTTDCVHYTTPSDGLTPGVDAIRPYASSIDLSDYDLLNGNTATIDFYFSEAVSGFDSSDVTVQSGSLSGFTTDSSSHYHATFTAGNYNDNSNVISIGTGYTDLAGNSPSSGSSSSNYIVWASPRLSSAAYNANEGVNTITLNFDETIDASAVNLSNIYIGSVQLTGAGKNSVDSSTVTITPTESQRVSIKALSSRTLMLDSGAVYDLAANSNEYYSANVLSFTQDTTKPIVSSLTVNDSTLTEADVGSSKFIVTVNFDETMNTSYTPGIEFIPEVSSTLSCDGVWTDSDTFTYTCDVADNDVTLSNIDIRVTGARDSTGNNPSSSNQMLSDTRADKFSIDTVKPVLTDLSVNDTWVGENNVGSGTFVVTATFAESMDTATVPGITFIPQQSATLACSGVWASSTVFNYSCDVTDAEVEQTDINIKVTNAKDTVGNKMDAETMTDAFNVDTVKPTISIIDNASGTWVNWDIITASPSDGIEIDNTKWIISSNSTCDSTKDALLNSGTADVNMIADSDSTYYGKYICFRTMDLAGNKKYVSSAQINHLDTTNPTTSGSITAGTLGDNNWYTSNVTYTLTQADNLSGVNDTNYCTDTNGDCTPDTSGTIVTVSAESATNYVKWYSVDNAANTQAVQISAAIKVDKTAPVTTLTQENGTAGWNNFDVNFSLSCADQNELSGCALTSYRIDDSSWVAYSSVVTLSFDGNHKIDYNSTDGAGNVETTGTYYIAVDKNKPITTFTQVNGTDGWNTASIDFNLACEDTNSGCATIYYALNLDSNWSEYSSPVTLVNDGNTLISFFSKDVAGNEESIQTRGIAIDNNLVVINDHNATKDLNMYYPVRCKLDTNALKTFSEMGSSIYPSSGYANILTVKANALDSNTDYNYTILCQTADANVYSVPFEFTTQVDSTAPEVELTATNITNNIVNISVTSNEPSTCRYVIGTDSNYDAMSNTTDTNLTWTALSSSMPQITGLSEGTDYTVAVTCRDNHNYDGNSSISFRTSSSSSSGSRSSGGGSGSVSTVKVLDVVESFTPTPSQVRTALEGADLSAGEIASYLEAAATGELKIDRNLVVNRTGSGILTRYNSTFSIIIRNNSGHELKNIYIVENVPKNIASTASQIVVPSIYQFKVLAADPVLEFTIASLKAGESAKVTYSIDKNVSGADFNSMQPAVARFTTAETVTTPVKPANNSNTNNTTVDNNTPVAPVEDNNNADTQAPVGVGLERLWGIAAIVIILLIIVGYFAVFQKSGKLHK